MPKDKEAKLERYAERYMDRLDEQFMSGSISEQEYSKAIRDLNNWVAWQYQVAAWEDMACR